MSASSSIQQPRSPLRGKLDDTTVYEPGSIYAAARSIALEMLREVKSSRYKPDHPLKRAARAAAKLRSREMRDKLHLLTLLILQAPGAARAQREMDSRHGGYKNRQARLYELIDFNDTFVDTVLALDDDERRTFTDRLKQEIDFMCSHIGVATLSDKHYEAITHGLSREIAVFREAKRLGYQARMTSRSQDAMGIDMIITDPETKKSIGIDVKTHSSFHWRLVDLQRQDRVTEEKRLECELAGFCTMRNGSGERAVDTVLFRVSTKRLGPIRQFRFVDPEPVSRLLASAIKHHGRYIVG